MQKVSWNMADFEAFRSAYQAAQGRRVFMFRGTRFLVKYAAYLIEYLDEQFKKESKDVDMGI